MNHSGTKLVLVLTGLALALGAVSWWYRYESAHRATQFWGPRAAGLVVEPGVVEALGLRPAAEGETETVELLPQLDGAYTVATRLDLTQARGTVHLRHALTIDSNFQWGQPASVSPVWRWALRFHDPQRQLLVLFTADLATLGRWRADSSSITTVSCQPMAETLQQYFEAVGLMD